MICKNSLQRKGRVYYLGWQTLGIIGIIDTSECIPTFGAGITTDNLEIHSKSVMIIQAIVILMI